MRNMSQRITDERDAFGGRTVVITGGASGIGLATARMVVDRGGRVILMGRSLGRLKAAQAELGAGAATIELDVTDEDAVRRAVTGIERIDHLITAAAGTLRGRLIDLDTQRARELFDTKFWGQHHCIKYAASRMAADGSVVVFSAWISRMPAAECRSLAAGEAAMEPLRRPVAWERRRVRFNAIPPGQIAPPLGRSRLAETGGRAHFDRVAHAHPGGRVETANDVAQAILFL